MTTPDASSGLRRRRAPTAWTGEDGMVCCLAFDHGVPLVLTGSAVPVWEELLGSCDQDGVFDVAGIVRTLAAEFAVPEDRMREDVGTVLAALESHRLIERL